MAGLLVLARVEARKAGNHVVEADSYFLATRPGAVRCRADTGGKGALRHLSAILLFKLTNIELPDSKLQGDRAPRALMDTWRTGRRPRERALD